MRQGDPELPEREESEHAEGIFAMWHDPTMYDPSQHGPPYLPESKSRMPVTAGQKEADAPLIILSQILQSIAADYGGAPLSELAAILAFLRAEAMVHQSHHWQTRGTTFYGDHLLYDRLYDDVQKLIDRVAERAVGAGHHILAHPLMHSYHAAVLVRVMYEGAPLDPSPSDYALLSLRMVHRFLAFEKMVYAILDERGQLSHGTDNLLQEIADKHEEHIYVLKQRTRTASYDRRDMAVK
jgi:DNA-binding ferritin-like protein